MKLRQKRIMSVEEKSISSTNSKNECLKLLRHANERFVVDLDKKKLQETSAKKKKKVG